MPTIPLNRITYSPKRIAVLSLILITIVSFSLFLYFYAFAQTPDSPITIPGSQFQICTSDVDQPACYTGNSPTPTLNWTFTSSNGASSQIAYWVQIDNNGNHSGGYPSPEINTGEVSSSTKSYTVPAGALQFNTTYYWKVAVKDNFGTWSGWTCADVTFTTAPSCNNPPTATNLSVTKGDYCTSPAHYFSWTYSDPDGDDESQFQFQVDDNSDFSSPEVDQTVTGTWSSGSSNNQTVVVAVSPGSDQIGYNTTYYWRVKVWDSQGEDSGWIAAGSSFTTERHRYPSIDFNWSPAAPSQDEDVLFSDQSTVYGGATKSSWSWTFEDGNPDSSIEQNPTIQFTADGSKSVTLQVTDSDSFSCQISQTVSVGFKLPGWKEILPW